MNLNLPFSDQKLTGLKKRQQIEAASRTMFLWVAIASVAMSICIVASQYFIEKLFYTAKVVSVKQQAAETLKRNVENAKNLQQSVDALAGNTDLGAIKTNPDDPNTKTVLDALPSVPDTTPLATSLQQAILSRSGVIINNITVQASAPLTPSTATTGATAAQPVEQPFTVDITGTYDKIRATVLDIERTIRPMKLTTITLSGEDAAMKAVLQGVTYYQPPKTTSIKQEPVQQ